MPAENENTPQSFLDPSSFSFGDKELEEARGLLERALAEDRVDDDRTTATLFGDGEAARLQVRGAFAARRPGTLCGLPVLQELFQRHAPQSELRVVARDGDRLQAGEIFLEVRALAADLLRLERTALNFLGRLSGIATEAARWVAEIQGAVGMDGAVGEIYDTRKTAPGWRYLEKYAVRVGGARNHRFDLHDAILVKDNHIALLRQAGLWDLDACVTRFRQECPGVFLQIEVDTRDDFLAALSAGVDAILLDNFGVEDIAWAVSRRDDWARDNQPRDGGRQVAEGGAAAGRREEITRPQLEASGGLCLESVRRIAETGVERISVGRLTHSAPELDIGLDIVGLEEDTDDQL